MNVAISVLFLDEILLIVFELLILASLNARTGWVRKKGSGRLVLMVCTSILLALQAGLVYDLQSYYQGEIGFKGGSWGDFRHDESVVILPGGTYQTKSISNWHTVMDLYIRIETAPVNATLYIRDENSPQVMRQLGNYSYAIVCFRLPYLYSCPFVIANWTANVHNPSQNESIDVSISIFREPVEDSGSLLQDSVVSPHNYPSIAIVTLWFYALWTMHHERPRKPTSHVQVGNQPEDCGSTDSLCARISGNLL